jgi:8-oxo-dGTP pyrophosphatase MutT (NUDIX family)
MPECYHERVEVIIFKDNLIGIVFDKNPNRITQTFYSFPGGHIDPGDSIENTARKECLEEVGIRLTGIQVLNYHHIYPKVTHLTEDQNQFSGVKTYVALAKYAGVDNSLYNSEGDGMKIEWVSMAEAIRRFDEGGEMYKPFRAALLRRLDSVKESALPSYTAW